MENQSAIVLPNEVLEVAKKEAEIKAAAELKAKQQAEEKAAKAPDKEKLIEFIEMLTIEIPKLKTKEAEIIANEINTKFIGFRNWAKKEAEKL